MKKLYKILGLSLLMLPMNVTLVLAQNVEVARDHSGNALIDFWLDNGAYLSYFLLAIGLITLIGVFFKKLGLRSPKEKYDYINSIQKKYYLIAGYFLLASFGLILTTFVMGGKFIYVYFIAQAAVSLIFTAMLIFALKFTFQFYYPTMVEKRLKKLRYQPRIASNGEKMELLSEEEEDDYLDEGMQAEESAFSVDYDVWVCKSTGEVVIEKYDGYLHAEKCPSCGYQTYQLVKEELVKKPTANREGKAYKYYSCTYCGHKGKRAHAIHPTHNKTKAKTSVTGAE